MKKDKSLQNEENWENEGGVTLPYVDESTQLFWWESIGT